MFKLDDCVAYIAINALKKVSENLNDVLIKHGITRVQWIALYYTAQNENIIQSELAKLMSITTPTLVRLIDRMEREELLKRSYDPRNRRVIRLSCTEKGHELNKKILPVADAFSNTITENISDDDLLAFTGVLNRLVENLPKTEKI